MGEPSDNLHPRLIEMMCRMEADRVAGDFDFLGYKDEIVGLHTQLPDEEHTGKTHLAIAITASVVRAGARGRYFDTVDLVTRLEEEARIGKAGALAA